MKLIEILKRKTLPLLLASTLTFSSLAGCKMDPIPIPTPDPIINELPESTKPLDNCTTDKLISYGNDTLTFYETTEQLESILVGDIIAGGVSDITPNGILCKVISISSDNTTVYTTQTNLEEAIKNCSVEFSNKLTPSQIESRILARGVMDRSLEEGFDFSINLENVILYDADEDTSTTNDQVMANGNISFNSDFDMYLKIQDFKLTGLKFENKINETVKLELTGEGSMPHIDKTVKIAEYNFTPFVAMWIPTAPPFPIVLAPKLEVNVNFEGELSSDIIISITQNAELISGLLYENGNWTPIGDLSNNFQFNGPQLTTNASAKVGVGPRLNLLLYGVAGPYAEINGYAKIEADVNKYPWWNFYGGLEAKLGVNVQVFGHTIADYNKTVIDFEKILTQADRDFEQMQKNSKGEIVFVSCRDGNEEIYVMDADYSNQTRLTNNSSTDRLPFWSPDGTQIVFNSNRDGNLEIYKMNADGSNQANLTNHLAIDYYPVWFRPGIYFITNRNGVYEEYMMNPDGSNPLPLCDFPDL